MSSTDDVPQKPQIQISEISKAIHWRWESIFLGTELWSTYTVTAVIVHQYDFPQEPSWRLVYDAADGPFDDRESFVQVDQHNAD